MEFKKLSELCTENIQKRTHDATVLTKSDLLEFNILKKIPNLSEEKKLSIIASRPGMGKSMFATQVVANYAMFENKPCYVFLNKETEERFLYRILNFVKSIDIINQIPIEICSFKKLSIDDFEKTIITNIKEGIVFVDSIDMVVSPSYRRMIAKLKSVVADKNLHIVLVSSIPRIFKNTSDKLKALSKLKIFNGADNVVVLHREPFDFDHPEKSNEVDLMVTDGYFSQINIKKLYWQSYNFK